MKLLGDTVLVNNFKPLPKKQSGILLPDDIHKRVAVVTGTVIHVGIKAQKHDTLKKGMTILVPNQFGTSFPGGSKLYNYEDILGIVS